MIKIGHFGTRLEYGGVESVVLNYTSQFSNGVFDNHFITQNINSAECIKLFESKGFKIHIVTHKRESILKNISDVVKVMKKEKFDIVHAHMTTLNFYILFIAWLFGCKVRISHSHNNYIETSFASKVINAVFSLLTRLFATDYFACGIDAAKFMYGSANLKKTYIMKNAIDSSKFKYNKELRSEMKSNLKLSDKFVIGHIGRFCNQKNHKFIVDIADRLKNTRQDFVVLLIGTGDLYEEINDEVSQRQLDYFFRFVGNTNETYKYYQAMDVFVLPSLFEGLPVVGIEAQYNGLKLLVSDFVDNRMALNDDKVTFLSINDVETWVSELNNIQKDYDRGVNDEVFISAGYDLKTEGHKLELFYIERWNFAYGKKL